MTNKTHAALTEYAQHTAADMGETVATAVRAMRDEPGEVALAVGCAADVVVEWCDSFVRTTSTEIRRLRGAAGEHGDLDQVRICDAALDGDWLAIAECARVLRDAEAQEDAA